MLCHGHAWILVGAAFVAPFLIGCHSDFPKPAQPKRAISLVGENRADGLPEPIAQARAPLGASTSLVRLLPLAGNTPFSAFTLVNENPDPIRGARHWPGIFGLMERRGPDDVFRSFPPRGGYCLSASAESEIEPHGSAIVSELPLLGGERFLPPGRYRFVVPHFRRSEPERPYAAVLPFEVRGLDPQESEDLLRLLDREDVRACADVSEALLEALLRTAAPEVLPRLFDLDAPTFEERMRFDEVLAFFPEHHGRLGQVAKSNAKGSLAAAVALLESRAQGDALVLAQKRLSQMLIEKEEPPLRALWALDRFSSEWGPEVVPRILKRLEASRQKEQKLALADLLVRAGIEALSANARRAVLVIRGVARRTSELDAKKALLEMASMLAEAIGDEPPSDHPGTGLSAIPEKGGSLDDPCHQLFSSLRYHPALRFSPLSWPVADRESLKTTFGTSGVEVWRPIGEE